MTVRNQMITIILLWEIFLEQIKITLHKTISLYLSRGNTKIDQKVSERKLFLDMFLLNYFQN